MANYEGTFRTSYFRVTDEKRYKDIVSHIRAEEINLWDDERPDENGGESVFHAFGGYGTINYLVPFSLNDEKIKKALSEGRQLTNEEGKIISADNIANAEEIYADDTLLCSVYDGDNCKLLAEELRKILNPNDAFVLIEVGNEKLRYMGGYATVVTVNGIKFISLEQIIRKTVEKLGLDKEVEFTY